jgi:hypothetical protein
MRKDRRRRSTRDRCGEVVSFFARHLIFDAAGDTERSAYSDETIAATASTRCGRINDARDFVSWLHNAFRSLFDARQTPVW